MQTLIAVDTGGTFTDLVMWHEGGTEVLKILSTPDDPAGAVLEGVAELVRRLPAGASPGRVVHGTTVATNAVLERRGARTVFVTNTGFSDLMTIGRQNRPALYSLEVRRAEPLVGRDRCLEIEGRIDKAGVELSAVGPAALGELIQRVSQLKPEAVAVCLLHSYANPVHETRVAARLREALPDVPVSSSHQVLPLFREYERAVATTLNAYVQPAMAAYLRRLGAQLPCDLLIMRSDGGTAPADDVATQPVHTLLSGPAGGVVGARRAGQSAGLERLIAFDMGGTSTDVSLIDGQAALTAEGRISGLPLAVTTIDIHTVGAGGGSIGWRDAGGALKVGPQSAGADPGPACYGQGDLPTVTDAHLLLGRLPARLRLGGAIALKTGRARGAINALAATLGTTAEETARAIIEVANARMVRAIKVISLERGHDPREFTLVCFGGAGGLHACELADALEMGRVLVPQAPGLLSAVGMLNADLRHEFTRSLLTKVPAGAAPPESVAQTIEGLRGDATSYLESIGVPAESQRLEVRCDLRYEGQSFELSVSADDLGQVGPDFHRLHNQRYGYSMSDRTLEWVAVRVQAVGLKAECPLFAGANRPDQPSKPGKRTGQTTYGQVFDRGLLAVGQTVAGPAVVTEYSACTLVPSGWGLEVLADGALLLRREGR